MKRLLILSCLIFSTGVQLNAQVNDKEFVPAIDNYYDSLLKESKMLELDSNKVIIWNELASYHQFSRPDSGIYYANQALQLARELSSISAELDAIASLSLSYQTLGDHAQSLKVSLNGLKMAEDAKDTLWIARFLLHLGVQYHYNEDYNQALIELLSAYALIKSQQKSELLVIIEAWIGNTYFLLDQVDSGFFHSSRAMNNSDRIDAFWVKPFPYRFLGQYHMRSNNLDSAIYYYKKANEYSTNASMTSKVRYQIDLAQIFNKLQMQDSAVSYGQEALQIALDFNLIPKTIEASYTLFEIFKDEDPVKALNYLSQSNREKEILDSLRIQSSYDYVINLDVQERQYEIEKATASYQDKVQRLWIFSVSGALISAIVLSFVLFRNNKDRQKANVLLKEQKEEIQSALENLKSTQSQLIQSEKMASLGELTAGIAHEIQNPLNFVNNFSEVSSELVEELKVERQKVNEKRDETLENEILEDIDQNLEKINHHGQRASDIVKGMLEHSKTGDGVKEPTDINALADEYLRLAYHGLRAKDKSFNADFKTEFDENLPMINVIPQDIGRVLLNLINNAFYACIERGQIAGSNFQPLVIVSTKIDKKFIEISVQDNGYGIPEDIKDKVFQPFFTTKPTGSGTGLGLSLSYDIVKAHGGEIKLETREGVHLPSYEAGTKFTIELPISL